MAVALVFPPPPPLNQASSEKAATPASALRTTAAERSAQRRRPVWDAHTGASRPYVQVPAAVAAVRRAWPAGDASGIMLPLV